MQTVAQGFFGGVEGDFFFVFFSFWGVDLDVQPSRKCFAHLKTSPSYTEEEGCGGVNLDLCSALKAIVQHAALFVKQEFHF